MDPPGANEPTPPEPWGFSWPQRLAFGVLLAILLGLLTVQWMRRPALLDVMRAEGPPTSLPRRIDPNTASVLELTRIPNLGPAMAEKIVAYRAARWETATEHIVFRQADDLTHVPGIKQKFVDQMLPYLDFPEDEPATQP